MKKLIFSCTLFSAFLFCSCSNTSMNGLVGYYTFNGGKTDDQSGNNNHGAAERVSFTTDRFGTANESVSFDSESDLIKVANPSFLKANSGTIVAWVKFENLGHIQYVASAGDENSTENYIGLLRVDPERHTLGIYQRGRDEKNWVEGSTVIGEKIYYHVAVLSNGHEWSIYVNGVKENLSIRAGANTGNWIGHLIGIDNFVIGNSVLLPPYAIPYLSGNIDEVRVYDRALAEAEITELYRKTKP